MRAFLFCCALLLLVVKAFSQDFKYDYVPLKSAGKLPAIFTQTGTEKTREGIRKQHDPKSDRKEKLEFVYESTFVLDELLKSGSVLLNDPVSVYVNQVADTLLAGDPELRSQVHIYVTKSTVVNAYTFNDGEIFVNLGLIAHLDNEAELAFVLSHEVMHYVKQHAFNAYLEYSKIDQGYYTPRTHEKDLLKSSYSKENELEADAEGYKLFQKSKYNRPAVLKAFDMLYLSDFPFKDIPFYRSFLQTNDLEFPDSYYLKELFDISEGEGYNDELSTHPNIKKRKAQLMSMYYTSDTSTDGNFLVSEKRFFSLRQVARFELCRLFLLRENYIEALYSAYVLSKEFPDNIYLQRTILKSLYALTMFKQDDGIDDRDYMDAIPHGPILPKYHQFSGNIQQLIYFMTKAGGKDLNIASIAYAWSLKKRYNDPVIDAITDSLFSTFRRNYVVKEDYFYKEKPKKINRDRDTTSKVHEDNMKEYLRYAFVGLLVSDSAFAQRIKGTFKTVEEDSYKIEKNRHNSDDERVTKNLSLGIDTIVIVSPFYVKFDQRKADQNRVLKADQGRSELIKTLQSCAEKIKIGYKLLDLSTFSDTAIDNYNDFAWANDWFMEKLTRGKNVDGMIFNTDETQRICDKYNSRYFLLTGIVTVRKKKSPGAVLLAFIPYAYPLLAYYFLKPEFITLYYNLLVDVKSGSVKMYSTSIVRNADSKDMLNAYVYSTLNQIKRK
jgi:Zn-dependent protease with chaperone function